MTLQPAAIPLIATLVLAGCASLPVPRLGGGGDATVASLVENRVWIEQDGLVPGTARAWMSSGQLLTTSCFELPRLASWRWTDVAALEWTEGDTRRRAELAAVGPDELVLLMEDASRPVLRLTAADAGGLC